MVDDLHPAAVRTLERVLGVQWRFELFDYDETFGVCGECHDGLFRRAAARFDTTGIRNDDGSRIDCSDFNRSTELRRKIAEAKAIVLKELRDGGNAVVIGDNLIEGNEINLL